MKKFLLIVLFSFLVISCVDKKDQGEDSEETNVEAVQEANTEASFEGTEVKEDGEAVEEETTEETIKTEEQVIE